MKPDEWYMALAIEEAKKSLQENIFPVGAVLVRDDEPIIYGRKTGEKHYSIDHAELNAYDQILLPGEKKPSGLVVYTTLEPCAMCIGLMLNVRAARIVYALEDPYGGGLRILRPEALPPRHSKEHPFIHGAVLRRESRELFKKYFKNQTEGFWSNRTNPLVKLCLHR